MPGSKMRLNLIGLCAATALSVLPALAADPPRVQWTKRFVGWETARGRCVQQTTDGGYIAAGENRLNGNRPLVGALLVKLDSMEATQWEKTIRGSGGIEANSVLQTADGGYVVAGTGVLAGTYPKACLTKLDAQGSLLWRRTFSRSNFASSSPVVETEDHGFAIVEAHPLSESGLVLYKTDSLGNDQWSKRYPAVYRDWGPASTPLRQTSDKGFIIGTKGLLKVDSLGSKQWLKTFDDVAYVNSVTQVSDGGYVATGRPRGSSGINLFKTDAKGNSQWGKTYTSSENDGGDWVEQTADGGYVIAGCSSYVATIIRTTSNGTLLWTDSLCGGHADCVRQTTDGGYIVTGTRLHMPDGAQSMFLTKLAPEGK